jgi:hypothetical protein
MIDIKKLPDGRIVIHYLNLLTEQEKNSSRPLFDESGRRTLPTDYDIALARAKKIGGRKYRAKWYGGGIVFADYENVIKAHIKRVVEEAEQE